MRNSGTGKKILILVCILAVPGFLYYLLNVGGKNRYKSLQYFGPKHLSGTYHTHHGEKIPDTTYHKLPDFTLYNQHGEKITPATFDKKIFVTSFFYTGCPDVCNKINEGMKTLADRYVNNKMVHFMSITVNPGGDDTSALKKYAAKYGFPADKWQFVTGDTAMVYNLIRKGFLVNALKVNDKEFVFSDKLVLIDAEKHIRGYYQATSPTAVNKLTDEIKVQITEELRKIKAPN
ncbi:SCO family protein [Mucilaginibacter limnophilus]|uniref:SCO family protein n=1 Tax=Mucilaginibacter limnophilus TaxID=1932778 RepID=A0A3S2UPY5_9SPHI|nr:SCO family protein [Mucilaginibacter limnophilus]RVU01555.1 SCO family protein [Mucilaginibacter limnophilus]